MIRRTASPAPIYGSAAWLALPDGVDKVASLIVAAEAWAASGDDLVDELHRELDHRRRVNKHLHDEEYQLGSEAHRKKRRHLPLAQPRYAGQEVRPLEEIGAGYAAELAEQRGTSREGGNQGCGAS